MKHFSAIATIVKVVNTFIPIDQYTLLCVIEAPSGYLTSQGNNPPGQIDSSSHYRDAWGIIQQASATARQSRSITGRELTSFRVSPSKENIATLGKFQFIYCAHGCPSCSCAVNYYFSISRNATYEFG